MAIRTVNSCCGNQGGLVEHFIGTAYDVVKTVYDNLGILQYIYDFLNQHGVLVTVDSVDELKALNTDMKYARVYTFSSAAGYGYTDYLYVEGNNSGVVPNAPDATGTWVVVASSSTGGDSGGSTAYIPYVYAQGSALGGETTIAVPNGTVGVPFIIVEGYMNTVGYGFTFDTATLTVTLAQPLEEGDEVVLLLTGTPAVPDNPNISNWVTINWLYNGGYAVGGEQVIAIPYTFEAIPAIYKNGERYYAGLADKSYTVDAANQRILLTEPLATNDRLIVQIGGESTTFIMTDRTVQEVARSANVHENEVILSTNTTQYLNGMKILYDVVAQKIYGLPTLPTNVYINSVLNGQLTYSPGNITVDLVHIVTGQDALDAVNTLQTNLASDTGATLVKTKQSITGAVSRTVASKVNETVSVKDFGATGDGITNDTSAIQAAIQSGARYVVYPEGTYILDCGVLLLESNQHHVGHNAILHAVEDKEGQAFFTGIEKALISFEGFRFEGAGTKAIAPAVSAVSCEYVTMDKCVAVYMALFSSKSRKCPQPMIAHDVGIGSGTTYPAVTSIGDYTRNVKVTNCTAVSDGSGVLSGEFQSAAIMVAYTQGAYIAGNDIDGLKEGIQWVGGDALSATEGYVLSNPRKCFNISIEGNSVKNAIGGIWGSMGDRVTVIGNTVNNCKDVCIDFESCTNSVANGNTAQDAANGCLVAIGVCKNVLFDGNAAIINPSVEYVSIGGIYFEENLTPGLTSVAFTNNTFVSFGKQSILHIKDCDTVKLDDNVFENVQVTTTTVTTQTQGLGSFSFCNNQMIFTAATLGQYTALTVGNFATSGGGFATISGNKIRLASPSTAQYGIRLNNTYGNGTCRMTVAGNVVIGAGEDINISLGSTSVINMSGNIFQTKGGSGAAHVVATGNCDASGTAWSW